MENYYALIMAGGGGTRLWPLSRQQRPKQMLALVQDESLFRVSVMRLTPIFPPERIFIVTGQSQVADLRADVPEVPPENFIVEPYGRDSGPAAALGVAHINCIDPDAMIAILTADHYISDDAGFLGALRAAYGVANQGYIVTLGIEPTFPATGFGYIQQAGQLTTVGSLSVYHSAGFKEKPTEEVAQQFLDSGIYSWNSGMFIWTAKQAMAEFDRQQPALHALLKRIQAAYGSAMYLDTIKHIWDEMPKISLDYAVMESAQNMAMIPVDIGWNDIGSWAAVYEVLSTGNNENIVQGGGRLVDIDTQGSLVNTDRVVVAIGLEDLIVIDTDDVLLICRRDNAQDVKQAVQYMKDNGLDVYL
jgi:mannose-1-phosphate guanylyltransferase